MIRNMHPDQFIFFIRPTHLWHLNNFQHVSTSQCSHNQRGARYGGSIQLEIPKIHVDANFQFWGQDEIPSYDFIFSLTVHPRILSFRSVCFDQLITLKKFALNNIMLWKININATHFNKFHQFWNFKFNFHW